MHFEYIKTDHSPTAFRLKELSGFFRMSVAWKS